MKSFLGSKTTIYLSLGLHKERPSYRRILQLIKEAIHPLKTWTLKKNSTFVGHFCHSGSGSTGPIDSGSNPDPVPDLVPQPCGAQWWIVAGCRSSCVRRWRMRGSGWPGAVSSWRERRTVPSPSGRVANKKPTKKTPLKKPPPKKPLKMPKWFFKSVLGGFLNFYFLWKLY
jgi:hypothetical protein